MKISTTMLTQSSADKAEDHLAHTLQPINALMFKLYFYTQFVTTPTCFDLS